MYREPAKKSSPKRENWLQFAPFIYSYLSVHPIDSMDTINTLAWVKGTSRNKSSFKFYEGALCIGGRRQIPNTNSNCEGVLTAYNVTIPKSEELDDDRLKPVFTPRCEITFREPIVGIEQFAASNIYQNSQHNLMAVAQEKQPQISVFNTNKLFENAREYSRSYRRDSLQTAILPGHKAPLTKIKGAKWKNGNYVLYSASLDGSVIQWDLEKSAKGTEMRYHRGGVLDLCVLHEELDSKGTDHWPDKPQMPEPYGIATIGEDQVCYLWDARQKNPTSKICTKEEGGLSAISALSKDGLITGTKGGKIQVWDLRRQANYTYQTKFDIREGHKAKVNKVELNHPIPQQYTSTEEDSKSKHLGKINFTSAGADRKIILWQERIHFIHEGHCLQNKEGTSQQVFFDRREDSRIYASASNEENVVMLWEPGIMLGQMQK